VWLHYIPFLIRSGSETLVLIGFFFFFFFCKLILFYFIATTIWYPIYILHHTWDILEPRTTRGLFSNYLIKIQFTPPKKRKRILSISFEMERNRSGIKLSFQFFFNNFTPTFFNNGQWGSSPFDFSTYTTKHQKATPDFLTPSLCWKLRQNVWKISDDLFECFSTTLVFSFWEGPTSPPSFYFGSDQILWPVRGGLTTLTFAFQGGQIKVAPAYLEG
jgi:hypothetical protein